MSPPPPHQQRRQQHGSLRSSPASQLTLVNNNVPFFEAATWKKREQDGRYLGQSYELNKEAEQPHASIALSLGSVQGCTGMLPLTISRDGQRLHNNLPQDFTTLDRVLKRTNPPAVSPGPTSPSQSSLRGVEPGQMSIALLRVSGINLGLIWTIDMHSHLHALCLFCQVVWQTLNTLRSLDDRQVLLRDLCPSHMLINWKEELPTPLIFS